MDNAVLTRFTRPLGKHTQDLPEGSYVYRYKSIQSSGKGLVAPQRQGDAIDEWDFVFSSKQDYEQWYKLLIAGFAELDEWMNYCRYFVRTAGNDGNYVRDGKSYPVKGDWTGFEMNTPRMAGFKAFLFENGWLGNWFELMERYK